MRQTKVPFELTPRTKRTWGLLSVNYKSLIEDGVIEYNKDNQIRILNNVDIYGHDFFYYGQVDRETQKIPDGIGIAVRSDNAQ